MGPPIRIGPTTFTITFQVMGIHPAYIYLLGRPWIHTTGAITSILHQKLKFITNDKMIVIGGEDDILVSHLTSFRYIDVNGETIETPFQSLEMVNVLTIQQTQEQPKYEPSMAFWKGAKAIMELVMSKARASLWKFIKRRTNLGWDTNRP